MLYRKIFSSGPSVVIAGSGVMKRQKSRKKSLFLSKDLHMSKKSSNFANSFVRNGAKGLFV